MDTVETLQWVNGGWDSGISTWDAIVRNEQSKGQVIFTSASALKHTPTLLLQTILARFKIPLFLFDDIYLKSNGFSGAKIEQNKLDYHHTIYSRFSVKKVYDSLRPNPTYIPLIAAHDVPEDTANQGFEPSTKRHSKSIRSRRTAVFGWQWFEMGFVVHANSHAGVTILALDVPKQLKNSLKRELQAKGDISHENSYQLFSTIVDGLIGMYNDSVWSIRNHVCQCEATRPEETNFPLLHEIARHAIHVSETLEVALQCIQSIKDQYDEFNKLDGTVDISKDVQRQSEIHIGVINKLQFQSNFLAALWRRNESNEKRIQNEITLAFNTAAQRDSKIQVRLAESAMKETMAMKAIAILTMVFLPATFVSSLFGMQFFYVGTTGANENSFEISDKFWVFWAVAVPLSLVTIVTWLVWEAKLKKTL